jgi:formylglycine-generating enzyme required for sulfatase activity
MGAPASEKGSNSSERPQHEVRISSFLMGRYPITQRQWQAIAKRNDLKKDRDLNPDPSSFKKPYQGRERWERPVEQVSWYDAVEFCQRLSKLTGRNYRLPSEAQWEYACRAIQNSPSKIQKEESIQNPKSKSGQTPRRRETQAVEARDDGSRKGTSTKRGNADQEIQNPTYPPFHFGETITSDLANYRATSTYMDDEPKGEYREQTTPVGMFPPNAWGLCDMHGNVWEWCEDTWHENYKKAPTDGSAWILEISSKPVFRGGSWRTQPIYCRSAYRGSTDTCADLASYLGFRVVCVP